MAKRQPSGKRRLRSTSSVLVNDNRQTREKTSRLSTFFKPSNLYRSHNALPKDFPVIGHYSELLHKTIQTDQHPQYEDAVRRGVVKLVSKSDFACRSRFGNRVVLVWVVRSVYQDGFE